MVPWEVKVAFVMLGAHAMNCISVKRIAFRSEKSNYKIQDWEMLPLLKLNLSLSHKGVKSPFDLCGECMI